MAVFIGNALNNTANATGAGTLIGFAGGNIALLQDGLGDTFVGFAGNDVVVAGGGDTVIIGGDGNDFIDGRSGNDMMDGGNGIDTMDVSFFAGSYVWNMATGVTNFSAFGEFAFNFENAITGAGNDSITGTAGSNSMRLGAGNDFADGGAGNDRLAGQDGNDRLFGNLGNDFLDGGAGNDGLYGGIGNDVMFGGDGLDYLNGGNGVDQMNGGLGADLFDYDAITDSGVALGTIDIISGFQNVPFLLGFIDRIDLRTIDANPFVALDQAFLFRDNLGFNGIGQVRWFNAAGNTFVELNTDQDAIPEMRIQLNGVYNLDAVDFVL
jgi:serralysin